MRFRAFVLALLALLAAPCAAAELSVDELNGLVGFPLFGPVELWREPPHAVIRRINVNCRGERSGGGQMFAARVDRNVFGCHISELRIFASGGVVKRVEFVFINKGDGIPGKRRNANIKNKMRHDRAELEKLLRANFGRPHRKSFGSGVLKRQLPTWSCGRHLFAMDYSDGEYMILRVLPAGEPAENRSGGGEEATPARQKEFAGRVKHLPNGDVFIDGVPMVDQGGKGYCVPATVERVVRYFGVDGVDMHKLAEKYHTGKGGGTSATGMVGGSRRLLTDCGLRMRDVGRLRRHTIIKQIDRGMPLLWIHYATPAFRARLDHSLKARGRATVEGWKRELASQKRFRPSTEGPHIALVIGYNRETDEFAVSNSWGERYRIAWVRYADMLQVDQKVSLFVVEPRK